MSIFRTAPCRPQAVRRLFLLALLPLLPLPTTAQTALDPVTITGTREPQPLSRSAADVVVIDAATIRDSTADSVEDLLRREAGLQLSRNGGPGQSTGYFLRGAATSGTVVLVDGVRVGSASLGQASFESLSLSQVERIEVRRGPGSSLYGADAVGGVIQIFTRRGEGSLRSTGRVAVGGYRSRQADLGLSGAQGGFDYAAGIGHERSRGVTAIRPNDQFGNHNPDRDGFEKTVGQLRLGWSPAAGHRLGVHATASKLDAQYDGAEFLPPDFAQDASADFRNRLETRTVAVDYRGELTRLWTTTLQASRQVDDLKSGGRDSSRARTTREQATWQNALHLAEGQDLVLAYEHLRERVDADFFDGRESRRNHGVVAGYTGRFGPAGVEASLRHDDNSVYGRHTTGSVGASVRLAPELKLRAVAGTTFRAPTFNDLFFPGYGVATIDPERGRSVEVGLDWQSGASSAWATLYRQHVKDLIGYQPDRTFCPADPAYDFGCAGNTGRASLRGATFGAAQRWGGLTVRAQLELLDATDRDTGQRLARRAAHQESLSADYDAGPWTVGASWLDVGSRPDGGIVLGGYDVLDLRGSWRFAPRWRLEAKLLNAFDRKTEPVRDYQGLGRQAWIGLRMDGRGV